LPSCRNSNKTTTTRCTVEQRDSAVVHRQSFRPLYQKHGTQTPLSVTGVPQPTGIRPGKMPIGSGRKDASGFRETLPFGFRWAIWHPAGSPVSAGPTGVAAGAARLHRPRIAGLLPEPVEGLRCRCFGCGFRVASEVFGAVNRSLTLAQRRSSSR
jgi:hypothetical protein